MRAIVIALATFIAAVAIGLAQAQVASPLVTQDNIQETICRPGYTKTVRPPATVTGRIKRRMMAAAGIHDTPRNYELDHIVPLEAGGAPNDAKNFQLQPWHGKCNAHQKDAVENAVHELICSGQMTLAQGQMTFVPTDHWKQAYADLIDEGGCESDDGRRASN
jgi:hypothetical protein